MSEARGAGRLGGVLVPLFSIPSSESWGIGEFPDVAILGRWLLESGQRLLQLLPINEMPPGKGSPYDALSAMALDPRFIALRHLEDWTACGGEAALDPNRRKSLAAVRAASRVEHEAVRDLKLAALRTAFARFLEAEWSDGTARAEDFGAFCEREAWWLDEYALFRALRAQHNERPWTGWTPALRRAGLDALADARVAQAGEIQFRQYVQWIADTQWRAVRRATAPLAVFGDLPFMVGADSADVWARQVEFRFDVSVGAPPDAFSADGQNWGLPVYRWDVVEAGGFEWLRRRARRHADLYDGYRVDHLVGFYRTYARPHDGSPPFFTPGDEDTQRKLGEHVLRVLREPGSPILAEDLGTVPDFVRASVARLGVPGYKVLRWERRWQEPGQPFVDPADYPPLAVATSGTHDTEPLVTWWVGAPAEERAAVLVLPSIRNRLSASERDAAASSEALTTACHSALLAALYASPAKILILPIGDLFGWPGRVNDPTAMGRENWTWRLPWPVERLADEPDAATLAKRLAEWASAYGR